MIHLLHVDTIRATEAKKLMQANMLQPLLRAATGSTFIETDLQSWIRWNCGD